MISFGTPARTRAKANLSAAKGVCGDGLSKTALPAIIAGRTELTATKYGKLSVQRKSRKECQKPEKVSLPRNDDQDDP